MVSSRTSVAPHLSSSGVSRDLAVESPIIYKGNKGGRESKYKIKSSNIQYVYSSEEIQMWHRFSAAQCLYMANDVIQVKQVKQGRGSD